jgi:hypothetical protein
MTNVVAMVAALLMATTMPAFAAEAAGQAQTDQARARLEQIKERLQLTPEQVEQLRPILTDEMEQFRAIRDKYSAGGQGRRDRRKMAREIKDIQSRTDEQLKKVLSKQQMDEMKKVRAEWRQQLRDRAGAAPR